MGLGDFATVKKSDAKHFPGPGQYAIPSSFGKTDGRTPTLKHRYGQNSPRSGTTQAVGPGAYEIKSSVGEAPKYSIAGPVKGGSSTEPTQTTIGPAYSPRQNNMAEAPTSPRYSMGRRVKGSTMRVEETPGPASVDLPSTLSKNGVTLGIRNNLQGRRAKEEMTPGPGAYEVDPFDKKLKEKKNAVERHSVGTDRAAKPAPGPGSYENNRGDIGAKAASARATAAATGKKPMFGARAYPPLPKPCGDPGPAAYDVEPDWSTIRKGVSIGSRPAEASELDTIHPKPGPGEYKIPSSFDKAKNKGFSISSRIEPPPPRLKVPGPGAYHAPQESLATEMMKSHQGIKFNAHHQFNDGAKVSPRSPRVDTQAPGPGAYDPKPIVPRPPGVPMTSRDHRGDIFGDMNNAPGPGTYQIKEPNSARGFTFYKGQFASDNPQKTPGPGEYNDQDAYGSTKGNRSIGFSKHNTLPPRNSDDYYY